MDELDHILLDQLHSARKRRVRIRRLRRMFHAPDYLEAMDRRVIGNIQFFESMIEDKKLLKKKRKKVKKISEDLLYRNPWVCYYRNAYIFIMLSFELIAYHLSLWNKKER